jgi:biotin carboxyl carrier protein
VTVDADHPQTWDLAPDDIHGVPGGDGPERPFRGTFVRERGVAAQDRAAGIRRFEVTVDGWVLTASVESATRARLRERAVDEEAAAHHHGPVRVGAPMAGRVVRVFVAEGDTVEAGQRLLAIEAMKMENEVRAPRAGVVAEIRVAVNDSVEHDDELVTVR